MKVLELFSGTGSVGKVCKEFGYEVISLDLKNADINIDIMNWNYKEKFNVGHFDIIWCSPPCNSFSVLQNAIRTKEEIYKNINDNGLPILNKTLEIIEYFQPKFYFIENPQTGRMKEFITDKPFVDVDYCMYCDWGYKKRTRIWTNKDKEKIKPLLCDKQCGNIIQVNNSFIHKKNCGNSSQFIKANTKSTTLKERYRIPEKLLYSLLE
jgi:hypothetical protein